jgi:antitoxin HicB
MQETKKYDFYTPSFMIIFALILCEIHLKNLTDMKHLTYRILLNREPEGGYTVTVPTLPGCVTYGENVEEAISMAKEAIGVYIESLVAHNQPIPDESNTLEYSLTIDALL